VGTGLCIPDLMVVMMNPGSSFPFKDTPVIFGWGVNRALVPLAKLAIETLCIGNPLGMLKLNTKYSYYHPLPRIYAKQLEWVQHVTSQCTGKC